MARQDHPVFGGPVVDELTRVRSVAIAKQRRLQRLLQHVGEPGSGRGPAPAEPTVALAQTTRAHLTTIGALAAAIENDQGPARRDLLATLRAEVELLEDVAGRAGGTSGRHVETLRLDAIVSASVDSARFRSVATILATFEPVRLRGDALDVRTVVDAAIDRACRSAGANGDVEVEVGHRGDLAVVRVWASAVGASDPRADVGLRDARRRAGDDAGAVAVVPAPGGGGELVEVTFPAIVLRAL